MTGLMKKKAGGLRGLRKFLGVSQLCKASTRKPGGTYQDRTETLQLYHSHGFFASPTISKLGRLGSQVLGSLV